MAKLLSALALAASFNARYPNLPAAGTLDELNAQAGTVDLQAGGVRPYSAMSEPLVYIKTREHIRISGDHVDAGTFVEVETSLARRLVASGRAEDADPAELATALKAQPGPAKK